MIGRGPHVELIEAGQTARLYEDDAVWKDVIRTNVLFNFVQQLKHIGVLAPETRSHSGQISEYEPAEWPWILRKQDARQRVIVSFWSGLRDE